MFNNRNYPKTDGQVTGADVNRDFNKFSTEESVTNELLLLLNSYQRKANMVDEETPHGLSKQIEYLSRSLGVLGDLWAQATYRYKRKASRKALPPEEQEELASLAAEQEKWERAYKSHENLINAKKITHKGLMAHFYGQYGDQ